jgi:two-component system sensor histidine kinase CpxA
VSIQVRDRGPGVPAHLLDRLFEPFFRVEESEGARSGGFGLGLSIARRAVLLHNGSITAENAGPGLLVRIRLPRSGRTAGHS